MAALVPIRMSPPLHDNSGEFYSALLIHDMIVILIGVSIVVSAILVRDMYDPLWFAQKNFRRPTVDIESVVDGFHELCDQLKLKVRPKGVVTDLASEPFSFGVHQGNSIVVLPRGVLGLHNVERKAVIVHELWHIKTDVETAYHKKIRKKLALGLLFVSMISILVVIYEHDALGWWNKKLVV